MIQTKTRNSHMRIVRDYDDTEPMTEELSSSIDPQDAPPASAEADDVSSVTAEALPRKRRGRQIAAAETDAAPDVENDASVEPPDGAVIDEDSDSSSADEDASELTIDLAALEAMLFSTHHPLTAGRLAELLDMESTKPIRAAIKTLNEQYESSNRCFRVDQVAGGYQLLTLPQHGELLKRLHQKEIDTKLTKAALETLAIIAYKQPILRAEIEAIRGVACGETIRSLMEKHLVKISGRAEEPGRPILYGTTRRFLELFGLNSLKDLPQNEAALGAPRAQ